MLHGFGYDLWVLDVDMYLGFWSLTIQILGYEDWAQVLGYDIIEEKSIKNKLELKMSSLKALIFSL